MMDRSIWLRRGLPALMCGLMLPVQSLGNMPASANMAAPVEVRITRLPDARIIAERFLRSLGEPAVINSERKSKRGWYFGVERPGVRVVGGSHFGLRVLEDGTVKIIPGA